MLVIGPPGTAKSAAVRRVAKVLNGSYFDYLLGRFTEPSELFGPVDIQKLKVGVVETATEGMLPEAEIVFLDEVFLGSTAILNTLLGILNERRFRRGQTSKECPLRICVGAANSLPEDESLSAFADRFLVRHFVDEVPDSQLESLLAQGWESDRVLPEVKIDMELLDRLTAIARSADVTGVHSLLADCIRLLRKENIKLSDRRIVKSQRLISAAAVIDGRTKPEESDIWPILHVIPRKEDQAAARDILKDKLAESHSSTLLDAAENASMGKLARAQRLLEKAEMHLALPREEQNRLAMEALGREIDTCFSATSIPEKLKLAREELIKELETAE